MLTKMPNDVRCWFAVTVLVVIVEFGSGVLSASHN